MNQKTIKAVALIPIIGMSLIAFALWFVFSLGFIRNIEDFLLIRSATSDDLLKGQPIRALFFQIQPFVTIIGGVIGWISLFCLSWFRKRSWADIPIFLIVGNVIGIVAALSPPVSIMITIWPILWSALLLANAFLKRRAPSFQGASVCDH